MDNGASVRSSRTNGASWRSSRTNGASVRRSRSFGASVRRRRSRSSGCIRMEDVPSNDVEGMPTTDHRQHRNTTNTRSRRKKKSRDLPPKELAKPWGEPTPEKSKRKRSSIKKILLKPFGHHHTHSIQKDKHKEKDPKDAFLFSSLLRCDPPEELYEFYDECCRTESVSSETPEEQEEEELFVDEEDSSTQRWRKYVAGRRFRLQWNKAWKDYTASRRCCGGGRVKSRKTSHHHHHSFGYLQISNKGKPCWKEDRNKIEYVAAGIIQAEWRKYKYTTCQAYQNANAIVKYYY